jgi:polysaccharide export outer membrane protein
MRSAVASFALLIAAGFAGCAATAHSQEPARDAAELGAMTYSDATPAYRFFSGDEIEITNYSAPSLSRTVTIGPDGRIALPMIAPVRAADLTKPELEAALVAAYSSQVRTPEIDVTPKTFGSRQVFVGGEVARPGIYPMPANMDALQAVSLAGGFLPSARRGEVLVMSRAEGETQTREVNLSNDAIRHGLPDAAPLQRYDVVYVPRSRISQVNLFMQQFVRDALPVQFSFYYDLNGNSNR